MSLPSRPVDAPTCVTGTDLRSSFREVPVGKVSTRPALEYGSGTVGVVLIHQVDADLCQWKEYAQTLARLGYRAISMTYLGDYVLEASAAAAELRKDGATKIVLMGASMGGTIALTTAAQLTPAPEAVVSLSGPDTYQDLDALTAIRKLTMPVFLGVAKGDEGFYESAVALYRACTAPHKPLVVEPSIAVHGVELLDVARVSVPMEKYLATYAPPLG